MLRLLTSAKPIGAVLSRSFHSARWMRQVVIPQPRDGIQTPAEFLQKIGRSMQDHESKLGADWAELWSNRSTERLKKAGVTACKDRKYILRQMTYFQQGKPIKEIKPKPKKAYRGRGPRVQKGKRVR